MRRAEYCNRPSIEFPIPINCPKDPFSDPYSPVNQLRGVRSILEQRVMQSEDYRYKCLVTRKPNDCDFYSFEHDTVLSLMDVYADLYFIAQLVTAARDHRDTSSFVISSTIGSLERRIQFLNTLLQAKLLETADRQEEQDPDTLNLFENRMKFDFRSDDVTRHASSTLHLPQIIQNRLLWHFEYSSFKSNYHTDTSEEEYKLIIDYLNTVPMNVTADLVSVDIKRRWMKPLLFENKHLQLVGQIQSLGGYRLPRMHTIIFIHNIAAICRCLYIC